MLEYEAEIEEFIFTLEIDNIDSTGKIVSIIFKLKDTIRGMTKSQFERGKIIRKELFHGLHKDKITDMQGECL